MSLARPQNSLRKLSSLPHYPLPLAASISSPCYSPRVDHLPRRHQKIANSHSQCQSFHTTTAYNAVRSPTTRPAKGVQSKADSPKGGVIFNAPIREDPNPKLKFLEEYGPIILNDIQRERLIDNSVTLESFMHIAKSLLEVSHREAPSASAIQNISQDPDLVFKIGHAISLRDPKLREWVLASCTRAGGRLPLYTLTTRLLRNSPLAPSAATENTLRDAILAQVETLAKSERDPRAMLIQAKVLGLRGQYAAALALVRDVMQRIHPTKRLIPLDDNLLGSGMEPPWEMFLWLKRGMMGESSTPTSTSTRAKEGYQVLGAEEEEVLRVGAVEYNDPVALVRYADIMMQRRDLKMYEECMAKAAAAGNPDACRKLGTFYYLTFLERRSSQTGGEVVETKEEEEGTTKGGVLAFLLTFFPGVQPRPRPRHEYRALALEWYRLGLAHGCVKSGLIFSVLSREDGGDVSILEEVLPLVKESQDMDSLIRELGSRWTDQEYRPEIPAHWLDV